MAEASAEAAEAAAAASVADCSAAAAALAAVARAEREEGMKRKGGCTIRSNVLVVTNLKKEEDGEGRPHPPPFCGLNKG